MHVPHSGIRGYLGHALVMKMTDGHKGKQDNMKHLKSLLISHWLTFHWSNRVTQSSPKSMEEMVYSAHNEP